MTQLGLLKLVFMLELLAAEYIFLCRLKRRRAFWVRLSLSYLACIAVTLFFPVLAYNAAYASVMFLLLFGISVLFLKLCYDESWINIFYCAFAAYTTQHVAYAFGELVMTVSGLTDVFNDLGGGVLGGGTLSNYGNGSVQLINAFEYLISFVCLAFTYWAFYLLFADRIKQGAELQLKKMSWFLIAFSLVLVQVIFNAVTVYYSYAHFDRLYYIISVLYNIICCIVALCLQFIVLKSERLENELGVISYLLREKEKQYAVSKETADLINQKCHDLKHTVRLWGRKTGALEEEIHDVEKMISIYDSAVKTGNEALDIILSEKSLLCVQSGIRLTCLTDAALLGFITEPDLYALFGNILDNAIEAVKRIEDTEKRVIALNIKRVNDMIAVGIKNYYEGRLEFEDGLPKTDKENTACHGFGMKSIRRIVEKYGGQLTVRAEEGVFFLDLLFFSLEKK